MIRTLVLAITVSAIAIVAGPVQAQAKKYASPEAVFEGAKAAGAKKDFKAIMECFTEDTVDGMAGTMVFVGALVKAFAKLDKSEKTANSVKAIDAIFEKHGLTEEKIKSVPKAESKEPEAIAKAVRSLGKLVKDKAEFFADMTKIMEAQGKGKDGLFDATATLKNVEITGDKGTGTISGKKGDKAVTFKKIDGGWRMELPIEIGGKKGASLNVPLFPDRAVIETLLQRPV